MNSVQVWGIRKTELRPGPGNTGTLTLYPGNTGSLALYPGNTGNSLVSWNYNKLSYVSKECGKLCSASEEHEDGTALQVNAQLPSPSLTVSEVISETQSALERPCV